MTQLFFFVLLLFMLIPASLAVLFASRYWIAVLWNGMWFLVIGEVASRAMANENGRYLALVFLGLYVYRMLTRPTSTVRFQMHDLRRNTDPFRAQHPRGPTRPRPEREAKPIDDSPQIIEAEYKKVSPERD